MGKSAGYLSSLTLAVLGTAALSGCYGNRVEELEKTVETLKNSPPYTEPQNFRAQISEETSQTVSQRVGEVDERRRRDRDYLDRSLSTQDGKIGRNETLILERTAQIIDTSRDVNTALRVLEDQRRSLDLLMGSDDAANPTGVHAYMRTTRVLDEALRNLQARLATGERLSAQTQRALDEYISGTLEDRRAMREYIRRSDVGVEAKIDYINNTYRPSLGRRRDTFLHPPVTLPEAPATPAAPEGNK